MSRQQGPRVRVAPGVYKRDNKLIIGYTDNGKWRTETLPDPPPDTKNPLTWAKQELKARQVGLHNGTIAARDDSTVSALFGEWQDSRDLAERTKQHERHLFNRHLGSIKGRRAQDVTPRDLARVLHGMRTRKPKPYSEWTRVAVHRILVGTFGLAVRREVLIKNPVDGLGPGERPRQKNARRVTVLDDAAMGKLVAATSTERWKAAVGLAGYAGLRLGELRALRWSDLDLDGNALSVSRSLLPDGTPKPPKTEAGERSIPLLPALRRLLVAWKVRSPHTGQDDLVICAYDGKPVQERNLRRALDAAKKAAGMENTDARLSWHSLRHSFASSLATDLEVPATTLARIVGHADAGFSLKVYAKDARDEATVVSDVLKRAAAAQIGR